MHCRPSWTEREKAAGSFLSWLIFIKHTLLLCWWSFFWSDTGNSFSMTWSLSSTSHYCKVVGQCRARRNVFPVKAHLPNLNANSMGNSDWDETKENPLRESWLILLTWLPTGVIIKIALKWMWNVLRELMVTGNGHRVRYKSISIWRQCLLTLGHVIRKHCLFWFRCGPHFDCARRSMLWDHVLSGGFAYLPAYSL